MYGAIPPHTYTSSWYGTSLSTGQIYVSPVPVENNVLMKTTCTGFDSKASNYRQCLLDFL